MITCTGHQINAEEQKGAEEQRRADEGKEEGVTHEKAFVKRKRFSIAKNRRGKLGSHLDIGHSHNLVTHPIFQPRIKNLFFRSQ